MINSCRNSKTALIKWLVKTPEQNFKLTEEYCKLKIPHKKVNYFHNHNRYLTYMVPIWYH